MAREQSLRLVEAQALAAESQNQMLRYQINPHFLFNTLNALSSLILQKDVERAERMVLSLSNFLRASLEKAPGDKITLADELDRPAPVPGHRAGAVRRPAGAVARPRRRSCATPWCPA